MDMSNSVLLPSPQARVWEALNDPEVLKRSIKGCESIDKSGDNAYKVAMTVAIGPVKAKFKGELTLADIDPPNAYTLKFEGQGGVAGFGKGSAHVTLAPEDSGTRLSYTVNAQVGGKIAQLGSRLIEGASKKMADDFFEAFRAAIAPAVAAAEITEATQAPMAQPAAPVVAPAPSIVVDEPTASSGAASSGDAPSNIVLTWLAIAIAAIAIWLQLPR